jgi:RNA polymerase sigma-70 factor (ECF subfamily)
VSCSVGQLSCMRRPALIAALIACTAGTAEAHAPLSRALALSPAGEGGMAVRLPGFGFVLRATDTEPFRYACDALLGLEPTETETPFVFGRDRSLLVGTAHGLRALDAQGCPKPASSTASSAFGDAPIVLLAAHPDDAGVIYAVTAGPAPALFVSEDGGESFTQRAELTAGATVTALVPATADVDAVYLTELDAEGRTSIVLATAAADTPTRVEQDAPRTLLHARAGPDATLWAMTRDAATRMVAIERAPGPEGPWQEALRVHFFGGFAVDTRGEQPVIWVGDEGGSVYRSDDGGDSFVDAYPSRASACLVQGSDALWSCTPGSTRQPALSALAQGAPDFEPVLTLNEVDALVTCAAEHDVEALCAQAWVEWRVDVRMEMTAAPNVAIPEAGKAAPPLAPVAQDAGVPDEALASGSDAVTEDDETPATTERNGSGGCSVTAAIGSPSACAPLTLGLTVALALAGLGLGLRAPARRPTLARVIDSLDPRSCTRVAWMATLRARAPGAPEAALDPASDAALVARAKLGDVEAFAQVYDRHAPAAQALLQRVLSSASEAEDVLHDVFLEAWQVVRTYDESRGSVRTWLLLRARSRGLDRLQRRAREPRPSDLSLLDGTAARADASAAALLAAPDAPLDRGLTVRHALERLEVAVRETLELTYYAGMTAVEIGEHMGVPTGTVRSRLARGLRTLEELLREVGGTRDGR